MASVVKDLLDEILNPFRPKWRNSLWSKRLDAVKELTDPLLLARIAREDEEAGVRMAALNNPRLADPGILAGIAQADPSEWVRSEAEHKLRGIRADEKRKEVEARVTAVKTNTDQRELREVIEKDNDWQVHLQALASITDPLALAVIAGKNRFAHVRKAALERIADQEQLAEIAEKDPDDGVRLAAAGRLADAALAQAVYAQIATAAADEDARLAAVGRLADPEPLIEVARGRQYEKARSLAREKLAAIAGELCADLETMGPEPESAARAERSVSWLIKIWALDWDAVVTSLVLRAAQATAAKIGSRTWEPAIRPLIRKLDHVRQSVAVGRGCGDELEVARALAVIGAPQALEPLRQVRFAVEAARRHLRSPRTEDEEFGYGIISESLQQGLHVLDDAIRQLELSAQ